jgi:hypothetical protein
MESNAIEFLSVDEQAPEQKLKEKKKECDSKIWPGLGSQPAPLHQGRDYQQA